MAGRRLALALIVAAAACAASARQPASDADLRLLEKARVPTDAVGVMQFFKSRTIDASEKERLNRLITQLGDDVYPVRERASAELISRGLPAISLLRTATNHADLEIARRASKCLQAIEIVPSGPLSLAAARRLRQLSPDGAAKVLLDFLPDADDATVADEIRSTLAALAIRGGSPDRELLSAIQDTNPIRRAAAGEALLRNNVAEARKLMTDADSEVRLRATLAAVVYGKDKEAVRGLIELLVDAPANQAWRVEDVLLRIAGDSGPSVALGKDAESRRRCREAWNEWWLKSANQIDLAKLDAPPRSLGLTLIVQYDGRQDVGRVYEINPAGEVQWSIENLRSPVDAIVLSQDRVLLAEQGLSQVSVRDFHGAGAGYRITVPGVTGINLMTDGNLLTVARHQIVEYDGKQAEVFKYVREQSDIVAATKMSSGEYAILTNTAQVLRVKPDKSKRELKLEGIRPRLNLGGIAPLDEDCLLVGHPGGVTEFGSDGKARKVKPVNGDVGSVQRLSNGNTLIAGTRDRIVQEFDRNNNVIWDFQPPENGLPRVARRR